VEFEGYINENRHWTFMNVGISVSLYDKFEDLGILLDIVRHNWEDEYYISVCSNHPDANEKIAPYKDDIDHFEQGAQIRYNPSDESTINNKMYRVHDTILRGCRGALSGPGVSHVFHVHADAWQLSEASLHSLVDELYKNDASVAFKINSARFKRRYPPGVLPDQMWLIDADDAKETGFFDRKALDFPPMMGVHCLWPILCLSHFGWGGVYQYSNRTEEVLWDGTPVQGNEARPMFFNPEYGQTHIATEDFQDELGKSLQAHYLNKYDVTEGNRIQNLFHNHKISEKKLFNLLNQWISGLNNQLRWYGLSVNEMDYDMRHIQPFLNEKSKVEKLKYGVSTIIGLPQLKIALGGMEDTLIKRIIKSMYLLFKSSDSNLAKSQKEMLENKMLDEYYRSVLRQEHFPPEALGDNTIFRDQELNNN
jgi:hypothetical protein